MEWVAARYARSTGKKNLARDQVVLDVFPPALLVEFFDSFFGGCCGEENRSNDLLKKLSLCCGNLELPNWAESYEIWASSLWKWQACEPCVAGLSKVTSGVKI